MQGDYKSGYQGLYRVGLPISEQGLIDSRPINTFSDLADVAISLKAANSRSRDQLRTSRKDGGPGIRCFRCQGYGHKSFECRGRGDASGPRIVCYSCNQPGHKSPDCPTRSDRSAPADTNKANEASRRGLGVKSDPKPKIANWVAVDAGSPVVRGKVNGMDCDFAPDTGAEIAVVPGCLVYESQLLPDCIQVRGATGGPVTLCTAKVKFSVNEKTFEQVVAVAQPGMLNNKVLFSVPMDNSMAMRLLLGAVDPSTVCEGEAGPPVIPRTPNHLITRMRLVTTLRRQV